MVRIVLLSLLVAATPSVAQEVARPADVVVTGRSLADKADALAACIARHCPTPDDVQDTLRYANGQFLAGDYEAARRTVIASLSRNRRAASAYPQPVADLWRAKSFLSSHLGDYHTFRIDAAEAIDSLRAGLPRLSEPVLMQRLEAGDAFAHNGQFGSAFQMYDDVRRQGEKTRQPGVIAAAQYRKALLYTGFARMSAEYKNVARRSIKPLLTATDPETMAYRENAVILSQLIDVRDRDPASIAGIVAAHRRPEPRPVLLYSPPVGDLLRTTGKPTRFASLPLPGQFASEDFIGQWIDISFRVAPDGTVRDVAVLRHSERLERPWVARVSAMIAGRRYARLALPFDAPGFTRVERFTITSAYAGLTTGTNTTIRDGVPRLEQVDLSEQPAMVPASIG